MQGRWFPFVLLITVVVVSAVVPGGGKISPRVDLLLTEGRTRRNAAREEVNLWVYFSDKDLQVGVESIRRQLHPHSLWRRRKVMDSGAGLVDYDDFPVNALYIEQV